MAKQEKRKRWSDPKFMLSVVLGLTLITIFILSFVAPPNNIQTTTDLELPTPIPFRTATSTPFVVPSPEPEGPNLSLNTAPTVQANGLFEVNVPSDWFVQRSDYDNNLQRARISYSNPTRLSVIDALLQYGVNFPSLEAVSNDYLNNEFFFDAWAEYDRFRETSRTLDERIEVNFELESRGIDYLGRQIAWQEESRLHMIRIISPANNPELMQALTDLIPPTFISYEDQSAGIPTWTNYHDLEQGFLFRHSGWQQVSGQVGSPVVFEDPLTGGRFFLRVNAGTELSDLEAAQAYLTETLRPRATLLSAQVTSRQFAEGFIISYQDRDADGNALSGVVLILQDQARGDLKIADFRLTVSDLDLLALDDPAQYDVLLQTINSFMVLPS